MKYTEQNCSTRQKIIDATLDIISSDGIYKVTIRKIAALAQVNIAAVNYHFGSKENLINESLNDITQQLIESFSPLKDESLEPEVRLRMFMVNYANIVTRYPELIKNFIKQSITDYPVPGNYEAFIKEEGCQLIGNTLKKIRAQDDDITIGMIIMQILACLDFPLLVDKMEELIQFDFYQEEDRNQYIEILVQNIVKR